MSRAETIYHLAEENFRIGKMLKEIVKHGEKEVAKAKKKTGEGRGWGEKARGAISKGLNKGLRWHYALQLPAFEQIRESPGFQAQVSRQRDLIDAEKQEILSILCGPDNILTTWKPAPETCL